MYACVRVEMEMLAFASGTRAESITHLQRRRDGLAGPTPRGSKVDDDKPTGVVR